MEYRLTEPFTKDKVNNFRAGDKVYITGTGALINNIDLYFQEYLTETTCEILKPSFVKQTKDISMKDYIEVNSAISIALMGYLHLVLKIISTFPSSKLLYSNPSP